MRIRLLLALSATVVLAACGDSSTGPQPLAPGSRSSDDILVCRGGYHVATRDDGTQYCEQDAEAASATTSSTSAARRGAP